MTILSDHAFRVFLTVITGGFAGIWFVHDALFLARLRGKPSTPLSRDQAFGYVMGMIIGLAGVYGTLRYNGVV